MLLPALSRGTIYISIIDFREAETDGPVRKPLGNKYEEKAGGGRNAVERKTQISRNIKGK